MRSRHGKRPNRSTASANAVATTASTALPPAARTSAPTVAATPFCEATIPPFEATAGLRTTQFCINGSMSADLDPVDAIAIKRVVPGELVRLVIRRLVAPDRVFGGVLADIQCPVRGGALERAIAVVLGLLHQVEPHVLRRDVVDRAMAGLLAAQCGGAVGDDCAGIADAHAAAFRMKIDAVLRLLDPAGGGIRHDSSPYFVVSGYFVVSEGGALRQFAALGCLSQLNEATQES